jgi:hypothetical protein
LISSVHFTFHASGDNAHLQFNKLIEVLPRWRITERISLTFSMQFT